MSNGDVQFHEYRPPRYTSDEIPKIVQWVINHSGGMIQNAKQAQYVLLGFVALSIIISFFLLSGGSQNGSAIPEDIKNKPQFLP